MNREPGSGSRALLDKLLVRAGVDSKKVGGYARIAQGHLAAAYAVASGAADACMATRSAARAFGLDFIPMHSERYDLILRRATLELPAAKAFLDVLQRSVLRQEARNAGRLRHGADGGGACLGARTRVEQACAKTRTCSPCSRAGLRSSATRASPITEPRPSGSGASPF